MHVSRHKRKSDVKSNEEKTHSITAAATVAAVDAAHERKIT